MWKILAFALLPWASEPELTPEQQKFLREEAVYLLSDEDVARFRALPTSDERDAFIERFWQVRDPVPETAANELREAHLARVREANAKFRESRAGYLTDRGRVYITLGPPSDVQAYPSSQDLYPLEIWFYYNLDIPTFPSALQLMFFKRNGVGEYRLFSPAFDGMKELIADRVTRGMIGPLGQVPFSVRRRWDIDIVKAAESVGPGQNMLSSEVVLAELRTPGFVFEKTRGNLASRVTSEASFGGELPVDVSIAYFRGEGDFSEAHLALEIPAEHLHVNQYDKKMLGRYDLLGTLTHVESGEVLEEIRDSLELEIAESDWEQARHFPILFESELELLPGRYRLELYVRDFVGRSLGVVDRNLFVPAFASDRMTLSSVLAAFKADEAEAAESPLPHQFGRLRLYPKPNHRFGAGQRVVAFLEVYCPPELAAEDPEVSVRFTLKRGEETVLDETNRFRSRVDRRDVIDVVKVISDPALPPGDYSLEALVTEPTSSFTDLARVDFTLGASEEMGRLSTVARPPELRPAETFFRRAHHYLAAERFDEAVKLFDVALTYEPYYQAARLGRARAEILGGHPEAGERSAEEALEREPKSADALSLLGLAQFRQAKYAEAAEAYRAAIAIAGEETSLLNALGETELALGDRDAAVRTLERSLELAPDQPRVREFLAQIQRSQ